MARIESSLESLLIDALDEASGTLSNVARRMPELVRLPPQYSFNVRYYGESTEDASEALARAEGEVQTSRSISLYLHYPYCRYLCDFCHYAVVGQRRELSQVSHGEILIRNLDLFLDQVPGVRTTAVSSLYLGGGTPSLFAPEERKQLVSKLRDRLVFDGNAEWGTEANPDSIDEPLLAGLELDGFNRISIGLQVLADEPLRQFGRLHSVAEAIAAVELILGRWRGTANVDLMYGLPETDPLALLRDIKRLAGMRFPSITLYRLRLGRVDERPSALMRRYSSSPGDFPGQEGVLAQNLAARTLLTEEGYQEGPLGWFTLGNAKARCYQDRWLHQFPLIGVGNSAYSYGRDWQIVQERALSVWRKEALAGHFPIGSAFYLRPDEATKRKLAFQLRYQGWVEMSESESGLLDDAKLRVMRDLGLTEGHTGRKRLELTKVGKALVDEVLESLFFTPCLSAIGVA